MMAVFADASYWIALLNPRDQLHCRAVDASRQFSSIQTVTSEMVLVEFLNSFSNADSYLRKAAADAAHGLRRNPNVTVVAQTPEQFEDALRRYRQASDKPWSVTDCASFDIMDSFRIESALTHDRQFVQAGYKALFR